MTTSTPSSTTFLPPTPALLTAARVDRDHFVNNTIAALEKAGLNAEAHTLAIGTWPTRAWPTLSTIAMYCEVDDDERILLMNARDHLVVLLVLYEVALEWDAVTNRVKVMGKDGVEVGATMTAPRSLRRRLSTQREEEMGGRDG